MWEQAQQQDFSSRAGDIPSKEQSLEWGHIPASEHGRNLTVEHYQGFTCPMVLMRGTRRLACPSGRNPISGIDGGSERGKSLQQSGRC